MTFKFSEAADPEWAPPALGWDCDGYPTDECLEFLVFGGEVKDA